MINISWKMCICFAGNNYAIASCHLIYKNPKKSISALFHFYIPIIAADELAFSKLPWQPSRFSDNKYHIHTKV